MRARTVSEVIAGAVALAAAVADAPSERTETLASFGDLGALAIDVGREEGDDLSDTVALLSAVAAEDLGTAFSVWAHRMVTEYTRSSALRDLHADLVAGRCAGSIAMATALQELAGMGSVPTVAVPDGDDLVVSGSIAWASNVAPGTVVVLPARRAAIDDPAADRGRVIVVAIVGEEGFATRPVEDLLALDHTRSASLRLDAVRVSPDRVIATDLAAAVERRPVHYLLQAALCRGLARRSLAESAPLLTGARSVLRGSWERLSADVASVDERLDRFARARIESRQRARSPSCATKPRGWRTRRRASRPPWWEAEPT